MTAATLQKQRLIGPEANGRLMSPAEFDRADFEDGWRFELINGVLVVSPVPSESEADPNEELGHWLRNYQELHPQGSALDATLGERLVRTGRNRRRPDRLIWTGLGRLPHQGEKPSVIVEFVSSGKRNRKRDYETKRTEYRKIKVQEYWIIDRFERVMVVFKKQSGRVVKLVIDESEIYTTELLPGFELPLAKLFALADRWQKR